MSENMEKTIGEVGRVDWSHFLLADFLELRWRLLHDWQAVLPGGEYFGQARIGDVCYDIQIEWLGEDEPGSSMRRMTESQEMKQKIQQRNRRRMKWISMT